MVGPAASEAGDFHRLPLAGAAFRFIPCMFVLFMWLGRMDMCQSTRNRLSLSHHRTATTFRCHVSSARPYLREPPLPRRRAANCLLLEAAYVPWVSFVISIQRLHANQYDIAKGYKPAQPR
ncbi:hypothetical protein ASPVEDRAFT_206987 [Aspergillus versicolor CBS 583.65]|uniref:Uncharacterized protein n=1 Tax=Aspergillus versicolor CBS 583.65 TaxID=1036611 RepID=A0A1L9P387_ASPVE|nr:uncharacterized protein ASPVEDRAFT_206987 [Aspergillus versicolor CBS 583.65]OJI95874.1 hypothetical protein ASPVEDRAFT_206987 [Aspergillus versicolor CBS 583.65]